MKKILLTISSSLILACTSSAQVAPNFNLLDKTGLTEVITNEQWTGTPTGGWSAVGGMSTPRTLTDGLTSTSDYLYGWGSTSLDFTFTGLSIGQTYLIDFNVGDGSSLTSNPLVSINHGGTTLFSEITDGLNPINNPRSVEFTAGATSETLRFTAANYGIIGNFSVSPTPEPSSTALLGLSALGLIARRKR